MPDHDLTARWTWGSTTPYAEPSWAQGRPSPYYDDSHRHLREVMRRWVETNIVPYAQEWEETGTYPSSLYGKAARDGLLMPCAAGKSIPEEWRGRYPIIGDIDPGRWNGFHDLVLHSEFSRVGGIGLYNSLLGSVVLPVPAIQRFAAPALCSRVVGDVLSGRKRLCLAITEPDAGSDVAAISTTATPSADQKTLVVNGEKKWITGGMLADYFLTLVNDTQVGGKTLVIVERDENLSTRHMKTSGSGAAATAFVDYDDVVVPLENVVGDRGQGLRYIFTNFNHERLFIGMQALGLARVCLEDSISFAQSRTTFGKHLVEQPVIRQKISHMARETEAAWAFMESLIDQLENMSTQSAESYLAGPTALFKAHAGIVLEKVVRDAVQIMGGLGLTRGGRGGRVEQIWRDVKAIVVPGGSEEILLDFAVKQALKTQKLAVNASKL